MRNYILQNFPFLEDDFDALTDYELFSKMVEYMRKSLEKLITFQNQLNDFNNKLNELQNEIDNFDVQDEVDKKLDEMLESGQLAEIVAQFLEYAGVLAFDTKVALKAGTNFVDGSIAVALGQATYNDGKTTYYKIRGVLTTDVIDEDNKLSLTNFPALIAEKIVNYYITDLYNLVDANKTLINYNKSHNLADNVQAFKNDLDLSEVLGSDYGLTSFLFTTINNVVKGIAIGNEWANYSGEKFSIATFDYTGGSISNATIVESLLDGHSNSMCKIDDTHILIIAMSHNYVYDIVNDTINEITTDIPYCRSCADYNGHIYLATDVDHTTSQTVNAMYEIGFNASYEPSLIAQYTLPNFNEKIKMQNQGMVIYQDLIIFPSFSDARLIIYDYNTKEYLRTQLFTAPYATELEDGCVYDGKLLMNNGYGEVFEPDLFAQRSYGDENHNTIARSLTDICLYDDIIKLNGNSNATITIDLNKYLSFNHTTTGDIATAGGMLESITLFCAIRNYPSSGAVHNSSVVEIPMYKTISYEGDTVSSFDKHFETHYMRWIGGTTNKFYRYTITGTYSLGGGNAVPKLTITIDPYLLGETFGTDGTQTVDITTNTSYPPVLYITKIIGHRKVGLGY